MLLGSIPPKLDRQHEKAWVLLTSPTCTQPIHSTQSHSRPSQPPVLPSTSPPATILSSLPPDDIHCQICQSPFDEHKMLLCDMCNAGWHMDCLLPPLTAIPHGTWKCPLRTPRHLLPQTGTRHLRLLTIYQNKIKLNKILYFQTLAPVFRPHTCTPIRKVSR